MNPITTTLRARAALALTLLLAGCAHSHHDQAASAPQTYPVVHAATATQPSNTQPTTAQPAQAAKPRPIYYIAPSAVDMKALLPAPSATQSPITRGEGDLLLAIRSMADDDAKHRMQREDNFTPFAFADVLGKTFTKEQYPLTAKLLKQAESDSAGITSQAKELWNRPRPAKQDPRISHLLELPESASYPSGHSTRAIMWARILAELVPSKTDDLRARARLVALDRVIAGVHYPTDVSAGMALGDAIADALLTSDAFKKDLEAARAEWK